MIKKFFILFICIIMVLCLAACGKNTMGNTPSTQSSNFNEITSKLEDDNPTESVFNTENITRITLYAYYGQGQGNDVPAKNITEITNWLRTITIDREATDNDVFPGTNTHFVEIEYSDGTIIKEGLDIISIDGTRYLLKKGKYPDCFKEIMSKTSLK